ncbi:MAG: class I SAM-dependent methyltransferase, partial [Anaerolineae bacterium]
LTINAFDGLGAHKMYETAFTCIQAEFDNLPLMENQFDLVIFNASFHYAVEYATTLTSAWRVLRSGGKVAIVDTAVYHNPASGQQMVREREALFQRTYGFASNALASENYLTYHRLAELAEQLDISWQFIWPIPRWRWTLRRWRTALRGQREPGQLPIIIGKKRD